MWTPPSVIFFDTETLPLVDGDLEVLALNLWVACHVDRRPPKGARPAAGWGRGRTGDELADWIVAACKGRRTVWAYGHNLNFDLTVTRLPERLAERGWQVRDFALDARSVWIRLANNTTTLTVCDSFTWLGESLEKVAGRVGATKAALPAWDAPDDDWWERCRSDVDITARAMLDLMGWWEREGLGRWSITGAHSGWNAARHQMRRGELVIDCDPDQVAQDRAAIRGGRRDVTRVGVLDGGPFVQIDFEQAYATIAANVALPVRRMAAFDSLPLDHRLLTSKRYGMIAEVEVECDRPRYPLPWGGVTWYPTGRFRTVLASPEIAWAAELGELRAVGAGRAHRLGGPLAGFFAWCVGVADGLEADAPQVARLVAKGWGRKVIGKTAGRSSRQVRRWPATSLGWHHVPGRDHSLDCRASWVTVGGETFQVAHDQDGDNIYPGVLAFVESHVRARLGRVLDLLGEGRWVQADTDGVILDVGECLELVGPVVKLANRARDGLGVAAAICDWLAPVCWPLVPRPKAMWDRLDVAGPQHYVAGGEARMSGVRGDAVRDEAGRFVGRTWPGLAWQMAHGDRRGFVRPVQSWTVPATTAHRWVTEGGAALPVSARIGADGRSGLVRWDETGWAARGVRLAEHQVAGLRPLYSG